MTDYYTEIWLYENESMHIPDAPSTSAEVGCVTKEAIERYDNG